MPINIISGLKQRVFKESGRLKAMYKVSLADSIALAEAKVNKMLLVTCDHHEFDIVEKANELEFYWVR